MKNRSIRTTILASVVLVNLLGAIVVMVYLHQSFSGSLEAEARDAVMVSSGIWQDITANGNGAVTADRLLADGGTLVERMKKVTGSDFGLLVSKDGLDATAYGKARTAKGEANDWDERESYVLAAGSDAALAERMQIGSAPDSVPETGKLVGIENGSCSKMCHGSVKGEGDFWGVSWSDDSKSRVHSVLPVADASGKPIGLLYSIKDISAHADSNKASLLQTLFVIGASLIVATLVIGGLLDALVFKRVKALTKDMEELTMRVVGGDFDAEFVPDGKKDEIGDFEETFAKFVQIVSSSLKSLMGQKQSA